MSVAIHGSNGNSPITDATANAEDVVEGKVFYNNSGRRTGTGTFLFHNVKTHHYLIPKGKTYNFNVSLENGINASGLLLPDLRSIESSGSYTYYSERFALNGTVIGCTFNGSELFMVNACMNSICVGWGVYFKEDKLFFYLNQNDGYIYIYGDCGTGSWVYAPVTPTFDIDMVLYYI